MSAKKLATDSRGNYRKDLGWKVDDGKRKQHRFYLGKELLQAQLRALKLDDLWAAVERSGQGSWNSLTLRIGMAIASGDESLTVDPAAHGLSFGDWIADDQHERTVFFPDEEGKVAWFRQLQQDFGKGIKLVLAGEEEACRIVDESEQFYRQAADRKRNLARPSSGQTLHQALDAFSAWLGKRYLTGTGQTSQFGMGCQRQAANIKDHSRDMPLSWFGLEAIEDLRTYWQNRPITKRGKPCSPDHARNVIKRIRDFIQWLHRAEDFAWRKPVDLEYSKARIPLTPAEKARRLSTTQVESYTVDELAVLWKYASPKERVFMALALNCGFGQMELATLQVSEIHLHQEHGYYPLSGSFIKRLRNKTDIYGEWKLWPETVKALEWYLEQRPKTAETALLVTKQGRSLAESTAGGNRNGRIANAWNGLTDRIKKDHPAFRGLSFNKLRKTAGNLVKKASDGEIKGVFHSRSQTVRTDDLDDVYTDRPFDKVFGALDTVRQRLAPVFGQVQDPFPADGKKHNPAISIGTIDKIVDMRKAGKTYAEIKEATGVSVPTIFCYLKRAELVKARPRHG